MKLIRNLFFTISITLFAIASIILDVFNYNPYQSNYLVFVNLYVSILFAVAGVASLVVYYTKIAANKDKSIYGFWWPSVRQAFLVAICIDIILILKGLKILDWWVAGPLMISIILLELYFQTSSPVAKHKKQTKQEAKS